jgi:hypothetical protein
VKEVFAMRKPLIRYDFGRGHMAERLPGEAVAKLVEHDLPVRKLQQELRAYLRAKPLTEVHPRQLLQIIVKYVKVQPTDFTDMEKVVGVEAARRMIPVAEAIPQLVWDTQDYLDYLDHEFGDRYRREINEMIELMVSSENEYRRAAHKWLNRAVVTPFEAMRYANRRRSRTQSQRPVPA